MQPRQSPLPPSRLRKEIETSTGLKCGYIPLPPDAQGRAFLAVQEALGIKELPIEMVKALRDAESILKDDSASDEAKTKAQEDMTAYMARKSENTNEMLHLLAVRNLVLFGLCVAHEEYAFETPRLRLVTAKPSEFLAYAAAIEDELNSDLGLAVFTQADIDEIVKAAGEAFRKDVDAEKND